MFVWRGGRGRGSFWGLRNKVAKGVHTFLYISFHFEGVLGEGVVTILFVIEK
jgi:hypothetical protein